jgi:hypothetical protein
MENENIILIQGKQGWSDATLLFLAETFIREYGHMEDFLFYLEGIARNEETDE